MSGLRRSALAAAGAGHGAGGQPLEPTARTGRPPAPTRSRLLRGSRRTRVPDLVPIPTPHGPSRAFTFFYLRRGLRIWRLTSPPRPLGPESPAWATPTCRTSGRTPPGRQAGPSTSHFDERRAGPWELDFKLCAASLEIGGRSADSSPARRRMVTWAVARTAGRRSREFGPATP